MHAREQGFTLVELMVVVLIVGILVGIAIPVYASTIDESERKTCFGNQRVVEGAAQVYAAERDLDPGGLAGVVTAGHPLAQSYIFKRPPRCPAAAVPADVSAPTAAEGAYTLDADGFVEACVFGFHGRYTE